MNPSTISDLSAIANPSTRFTPIAAARILVTALAAMLLSGCGGDSSGNSTDLLPPAAFSGTVSTPRGLAEPVIEFKSSDGTRLEAALDESGQYSLDDLQFGGQYLMRADLGNANFLYSIVHITQETDNRQNLHSYTDLVARTWFTDQNLDINSVFASGASIENFPSVDAINTIDTNVQNIVSDALQFYGLSDVVLSTETYSADGTGVDRFLNENPVIIRDNRATIIVNDPQTNLQAVAVNRVSLQTTFGILDVTPPDTVRDVRALGTSDEENNGVIVVAWTTARDNIGVATYDIFRDGELIGHTPFPLLRDANVIPDVDHSYTLITRDESGNSSVESAAIVGRTLTEPDITAPEIPSSTTLSATTDSVDVFWSHANLFDVATFEVTRTGGEAILVREVTSTQLSDITVASGTEYCYEITAVDASDNRSEANPSNCITTSGSAVDPIEMTNIPATVEMAQESISGSEGTTISAFVNRLGDPSGAVSINYVITPGTAVADEDYISAEGTLVWSDGDIVARRIDIQLLTDGITEGSETLTVVLTTSSSNAVISNPVTTVMITDID